MRTQKIMGYEGHELNVDIPTEATGSTEAIILSPNNFGVVFGVKGTGGNDDVPAVKEKLVESFTVPADTSPAVKEKLVETFNIPVGEGAFTAGDISVFYNSATPTLVTLTGLEATSADIADKIVLAAPVGYTVSTVGQAISIEKDVAGACAIPLSISFGSTGVTEAIVELTPGTDRVGSIVPGDISVFYNISGATLVAVTRDMMPSDITDAIVAAAPTSYAVTNVDGAVSIEKKVAGANVIPLSISFGDTGVTQNTRVFTAGADLIHGGGSAKATSFKVQYSIDTRAKLNAGTARFSDIETLASGAAYKEYVYSHPVSALRFDVLTAASDSSINLVVKTAE